MTITIFLFEFYLFILSLANLLMFSRLSQGHIKNVNKLWSEAEHRLCVRHVYEPKGQMEGFVVWESVVEYC